MLNKELKFDRYENSFLWLKDAGVALPVYNVEAPVIPLKASKSSNVFRLFSNDTGLLTSAYPAENRCLRHQKIYCGLPYSTCLSLSNRGRYTTFPLE